MTHDPLPGSAAVTYLDGLRAARAVVERQTDLMELVHFDRPSDFRKGVLTCLVALDKEIQEANEAERAARCCCDGAEMCAPRAIDLPNHCGPMNEGCRCQTSGVRCRYCQRPTTDDQERAWRMCSACHDEGVHGG